MNFAPSLFYNESMSEKRPAPPVHEGDTQTATKTRPKLKRPPKYRVVLLNDDYTPMEFVVWLLINVFHKTQPEATRLMLTVHKTGRGVAGVYTHDIARTKVYQVQTLAEQHGHPLQSVLEVVEPEDGE